jgi:hypothetical protein
MFPVHWVVMLIHFFGDSGESFITVDGKNLLAAVPFETLEGFGDAFFVPFAFIFRWSDVAPRFNLYGSSYRTLAIVIIIATTQIFMMVAHVTGWFHRHLLAVLDCRTSCALLRHIGRQWAADADYVSTRIAQPASHSIFDRPKT